MEADMQISISTSNSGPNVLLVPGIGGLEEAHEDICRGRIAAGLENLFDDLSVRREDAPAAWPDFARTCLDHPLRRVLHQDPFTYRAFSKPRGYAGDAVMMDYIYGLGEASTAARSATPLGRAIFAHMSTRPSARAVRYRRRLLADLIDDTASRGGHSVFALAAGHLREVELSGAVQNGQITNFVAMDQDAASLAVVARDYARLGINAVSGSVRHILAGKAQPGEFDFVYAAGLFDYLGAPVATALTRKLFDMTRPGGTLLIPNFKTGAADTAYMEAFMDWRLIYRNHDDMRALASALPAADVADFEIFDDDDDTITFLAASKAR
jgi:extracellular factor (EF) 3-hydroxypalmitic acid methyl ester biosynthesis protein